MILADLDQASVILQVFALTPDGAEKLDVSSGTVRVYTVSGTETDVLPSTALSNVGVTNKWRYEWAPVSLAVGEYVVEYVLIDTDGIETLIGEDLIVRDIAEQVTLTDVQSRVILIQSDVDIIEKVETGRWKIENNQMTFYEDDEITPLLVFDLKDDAGIPSEDRVFERVPV